jgi:hypothetical protein
MSLSENDRMIQALSTNRSYETFHVGILPGRARCRGDFIEPDRSDFSAEQRTVDRIPIVQQVFRCIVQTNCLENLLRCPRCCWMLCRVGVEYSPSIMTKNHQHEQDTNSRCWESDKIDSDDIRCVILQEGTPRLRRRSSASNHILRNCRFRNNESEFVDFAVDSRCSPQWIC